MMTNKKMIKMMQQKGKKKVSFRLDESLYENVRSVTDNFNSIDEFYTILTEEFLRGELLEGYTLKMAFVKKEND